jgi:hypothetical protein
MSQMIGLVLYFDLLSIWSDKSRYRPQALKLSISLYIVSVAITKPSMLIPIIAFWFALELKRKMFFTVLVASLLAVLTRSVWGNLVWNVISINLDFPSFTNPLIYLWIAVLLIVIGNPINPRVVFIRRFVGIALFIQIFFLFFDIKDERGVERWIVDPIFVAILILLFSNNGPILRIRSKNFAILMFVFILFFLDTLIELVGLGVNWLVFALALVSVFILFVYKSHQRNVSFSLDSIRQIGIRKIKKIFVTFGTIILLLSFNPLIYNDSLSLIKKNNTTQGISLSRQDYKEIAEIRNVLTQERKVSVVFNNHICRGQPFNSTVQIDSPCDIRINLVSALLETRSPFEYAQFGLRKGDMEKQKEMLLINSFSQSLKSVESFNEWNRNYVDSVFSNRKTRFLLIDKSVTSRTLYYGQLIFLGKRFELFKLA